MQNELSGEFRTQRSISLRFNAIRIEDWYAGLNFEIEGDSVYRQQFAPVDIVDYQSTIVTAFVHIKDNYLGGRSRERSRRPTGIAYLFRWL